LQENPFLEISQYIRKNRLIGEKMNKLQLTTFLLIFVMLTSPIVMVSAEDQVIELTEGYFGQVMPNVTYSHSATSSGSGRFNEYYITTSGAQSILIEMWYHTSGSTAWKSGDDLDLYYRYNARVANCNSQTCSTYTQVSWNWYEAPEEIDVNNPADGQHHIRVQRYSGSGTTGYYFRFSVVESDTTPPTVSITSPSNGATVSGTINIAASASDNIGVTRVDFYAGGHFQGSDSSAPYSISFDTTTLSNGGTTIQAIAFDAAGNSASDSISVTINNQVSSPGTCGETPRVTGSMPWWNDAINVETAHAAGCYGEGTTVVILDTGLGTGYGSLFPSGSINTQYSHSYTKSLGYDNVDWYQDTNGHGTAVTATVLGYNVPSSWGMTNNYVQGVAPNAQIIMYRVVFWVGGGVTATAMLNNWAQAINDAVTLHQSGVLGTDSMVISMSLGYSSSNTALNNAIANARANGVVVSVSAGNSGPDPNTTGWPANHADATSVAAAGWDGLTGAYGVAGITTNIPENNFNGLLLADFSSRGKVEITGIGWNLALPNWDNSYRYISGTSFSAPQVSGVYALIFSMYGAIGATSAEQYMMDSAYWGPTGSGSMTSSAWGAGFVQADGALGL
jgi:hypothetical protein